MIRLLPIWIFMSSMVLDCRIEAQVVFENRTSELGIDYDGRTFGATWGDVNGDGLFDLFLSHHFLISDANRTEPTIYLNDSTIFGADTIMPPLAGEADVHSGLFFDSDNDGDQDLIAVTGGTKRHLFYLNEGENSLLERAVESQLDYDLARGRHTTSFDVDNNGILDLLLSHESPTNVDQPGSKTVTRAFGQVFQETDIGFETDYSFCAYLVDFDRDGTSELVAMLRDEIQIYSIESNQLVSLDTIPIALVQDASFGDFDGNGYVDMFLCRGSRSDSELGAFSSNNVRFKSRMVGSNQYTSMEFQTEGDIELTIVPNKDLSYDIVLGESEILESAAIGERQIQVDANDPLAVGFQEIDTELLLGWTVNIGKIDDDTWRIDLANVGPNITIGVNLFSSEAVTLGDSEGFVVPDATYRDVLLFNPGNLDFSPLVIDNQAVVNSQNCTSADFDNDGDLDIYVLHSGNAIDSPDVLYMNDGTGNFSSISQSQGIPGILEGVGDAVTHIDYNNDGQMDFFLAMGLGPVFLDSADVHLMENQGNSNHWFGANLVGVQSNRDGQGSHIFIYSEGLEQQAHRDGGIHLNAQDDPRIHFGLGDRTLVDSLIILWPSGTIDKHFDLEVDKYYEFVEGTGNEWINGIQEITPLYQGDINAILEGLSLDIGQVLLYDDLGRLVSAGQRQLSFAEEYLTPLNVVVLDKSGGYLKTFLWLPE